MKPQTPEEYLKELEKTGMLHEFSPETLVLGAFRDGQKSRDDERDDEVQFLRGSLARYMIENSIIEEILEGIYDGHLSDYETELTELVRLYKESHG